jgi:hypothetical protein
MDLNNDTFNLFKKRLEIIFDNLFPGILITELFLRIGFFHDNINNISNLILYIIWGFSLSLIYNSLFMLSIDKNSGTRLTVLNNCIIIFCAYIIKLIIPYSIYVLKLIKSNSYVLNYVLNIINNIIHNNIVTTVFGFLIILMIYKIFHYKSIRE